MNDLRFAVRQLLKSPGFTLVALLTLAIGIGANTAIFSLVNALLLRPLHYPEADRILQISEVPANGGRAGATGGVFMDWQDRATTLSAIAAAHNISKNLTGHGDPIRLTGLDVSADFLRVLGVQPKLGRDFAPDEDAPGGNRHVAIITDELWRTHFNADPAIVGKAIQLDTESYTLIGVLPPRALLANNVSLLTPACIRADAWKQSRDFNFPCFVIARLKPGATMTQTITELNTAKASLNSQYPSFKAQWTVTAETLQESTFGSTRPYVLTLLAAVGVVLLIACSNVANLLLGKAWARQGEIAIRTALGATPSRIVRQLLTESVLLSLLGGGAGILLGAALIDPLVRFGGGAGPITVDVVVDRNVLLFALGASVLTGVVFGLVPALSVARTDFHEQLKEGTRGSSSGRRKRVQSLLIVAETALTVVLLASTGLLLRSFVKATRADAGFSKQNALVFDLSQPGPKVPTVGHRVRFISEVLRRMKQIPGVERAGMLSSYPMNGQQYYGDLVSREDQPEKRNDLRAGFDSVAGESFQALGIPLLQGRYFSDADNSETAPKVTIINETLSRQLFGNESPIGQLLHFKDEAWQIVGVVGNVRRFQLDVPITPQIYVPQVHFPWYNSIILRTQVPPLTLANTVREALREVDPEQPIANLGTLEAAVDNSLSTRRVILTLLGVFAGTALLLASIGIYGVMSYSVTQRTREMGIRIALGAQLPAVIGMIVVNGLKLVAIGLGIGLLGSLGTNQLIASQLFEVAPLDPSILALVAATLTATSLAACWVPAHRATRVDPIVALRTE